MAKGKKSAHDDDEHEHVAEHGTPEKAVVRSPTLPVEAKAPAGEPVGHARHAETAEQAAKIQEMEHSKIPLPGSRDYVAGQPVSEEEAAQTQAEADRLAQAGKAQRSEAEKRIAENDPSDPNYDPSARSRG